MRLGFIVPLIVLAAGCTEQGGVLIATRVDFGAAPAGLEVEGVIVVENVGTGSGRIKGVLSSVDLVGPEHKFRVTSVERQVAAGGITNIPVSFTALAPHDAPVSAVVRFETDGDPLVVRMSGRGVSRGLSVDPQPLDFGAVVIGRDHRLDVWVRNELDVPVELNTAIDVNGRAQIDTVMGNGRFELLSPVEPNGSLIPGTALLGPGEARALLVRYTPTPIDGRDDRARWTISHCNSSACAVEIRMEGRARAAALSCAPAQLDLRAAVGETVRGTVTCTNDTAARTQVTGWRFAETMSAEFEAAPPASSTLLEPGDSIEIPIVFTPVAPRGLRAPAPLSVEAIDVGTRRTLGDSSIVVRGTAGRAIIETSPVCDAGEAPVGGRAHCLVEIRNAGDEALRIDRITTDHPDFTISMPAAVVEPGAVATVDVVFAPSLATLVESRLVVHSNDVVRPQAEVRLLGAGIAGAACAFQISHGTLDFGVVLPGSSIDRAVRLDNVGDSPCVVAGVRFSGADPAFTLRSSSDPFTLAAHDSRVLEFRFAPTVDGLAFASVEVLAPAIGSEPPTIVLRGRGGDAGLEITPAPVEFGVVPLSCASAEREVQIRNPGTVELRIDDISIERGSAFGLRADAPRTPLQLRAGESTTVVVSVERPMLGELLGALVVTAAGTDGPRIAQLRAQGSADGRVEDRTVTPNIGATDVIFVIDRGFMAAVNLNDLDRSFQGFVSTAGSLRADWQVGVLFASGGPTFCPVPLGPQPEDGFQGICGYLVQTATRPTRLIDDTNGPEAFFGEAIRAPTVQGQPNTAFRAVVNAVSEPIRSTWNAGLLRPGADLAVVVVSNREETSTTSLSTLTTAMLASRPSSARVTASAVVALPGDSCGTPALRLIEAASQLDGGTWSLCTEDPFIVGSQLAEDVLGPPTRVALSYLPDPNSLEVRVDGRPVVRGGGGWDYDPLRNSVFFARTARPEPGSEVVLRYVRACR